MGEGAEKEEEDSEERGGSEALDIWENPLDDDIVVSGGANAGGQTTRE